MIDKIVRRFGDLWGGSCLRSFLGECIVRFSCSFDWLTSWLRLVVTKSRISFWPVLLDWILLWISFWLKLWNDLSTIILKRISIFICWFWGEIRGKIYWRKYWYWNTNWIELGRGYWFWERFFWFCEIFLYCSHRAICWCTSYAIDSRFKCLTNKISAIFCFLLLNSDEICFKLKVYWQIGFIWIWYLLVSSRHFHKIQSFSQSIYIRFICFFMFHFLDHMICVLYWLIEFDISNDFL